MYFIKQKKLACALLTVLMIINTMLLVVYAEEQKYYFDSTVNTGKDNGYSKQNPLELNDPHYGWKLGSFIISGYTRVIKDEQDNLVFLKNLGDKVTLSFRLEQDIDKLNGNKLSISEDKNGYDKYYEIEKTNFGRGALIIKHTDYQNIHKEPTKYFNYLPALSTNANTTV